MFLFWHVSYQIFKAQRFLKKWYPLYNKVMMRSHVESKFFFHSEQTDHLIDDDGVNIIYKADSGLKLGIKEMLHLTQSKPNLNTRCTNEFDLKTLMFLNQT